MARHAIGASEGTARQGACFRGGLIMHMCINPFSSVMHVECLPLRHPKRTVKSATPLWERRQTSSLDVNVNVTGHVNPDAD
jgi:hypothetical protein